MVAAREVVVLAAAVVPAPAGGAVDGFGVVEKKGVVETLHSREVVDPLRCVVVPTGQGMQLSDP